MWAGRQVCLYQPNEVWQVMVPKAAEICSNQDLSGKNIDLLSSTPSCLMITKCFINTNKKIPEESCSFLHYRWRWSRDR